MSLQTSKDWASVEKITYYARMRQKSKIIEGEEYIENPYKSNEKRGRPSSHRPSAFCKSAYSSECEQDKKEVNFKRKAKGERKNKN